MTSVKPRREPTDNGGDRCGRTFTSVTSQKFLGEFSERGARLARRDDRAYREYVREEQRRQAGCPARKMTSKF